MGVPEDPWPGPQRPRPAGDSFGTSSLMLSLFLLLLVFFVVLTAMSSLDGIRTREVSNSLAATFAEPSPTQPPTTEPHPSGPPPLVTEVRDAIETAIPAVRIRMVQPGDLMEARFEADALFFPDTATLRPAQGRLLDRLVAALSLPPEGQRTLMEAVVGVDAVLPTTETTEVARVGALAREMWRRGAPPDTAVFGLEPGEARMLRMTFRTVADDRARTKASEPKAPEPIASDGPAISPPPRRH
ncbi:MAG: hypothetical protein H7840_14485 [Alphaproteobacteria bacterium]